jgi:hypothetical protein
MIALRRETIESDAPDLRLVPDLERRATAEDVAALTEFFLGNQTRRMAEYTKPSEFLAEGITFLEGEGPTEYQLEILDEYWLGGTYSRMAVTGPRGLGKSAMASWLVIFCWLYWTAVGVDWKIVTTAGSYRQVRLLWREVHKWAARINWEAIGMDPELHRELQVMGIVSGDKISEASAASTANESLIEGAHATAVMFLVDEAKALQDPIWDSIEGTFTTAPRSPHARQIWFAISTPGSRTGRFSAIHHDRKAFADWTPKQVKVERAIAAGQINPAVVEARRLQWGEDSALFRNQMLGEFSTVDDDGVVPLQWALDAVERWEDWRDEGIITCLPGFDLQYWGIAGEAPDAWGLDVGDTGPDRNTLAPRWGNVIGSLIWWGKGDPLQTAETALAHLRARGAQGRVVVDANGVGAGTVAALKRETVLPPHDPDITLPEAERSQRRAWARTPLNVVPFMAQERTRQPGGKPLTDQAGVQEFGNDRAAAWWNLRELLDPQNGELLALPPGDDLLGELTAPRYRNGAGGKVFIEAKEDIKKRLGVSTDLADAVVQSCWPWGGRRATPTGALPYTGDKGIGAMKSWYDSFGGDVYE